MKNNLKSYFQKETKMETCVSIKEETRRSNGKENCVKENTIQTPAAIRREVRNEGKEEPKSKLNGKRVKRVVDSDEEYNAKEDEAKQDDSDFLDENELDDLVKDENEDEVDPYLNYKPTYKTPAQNKLNNLEAFRKKQTTQCDASKRLDMFGFNKSAEKSVVKSTKTSAFKPRKTQVSTKLPSFTETKEKINEMEQMTEQEIADGLPDFLQENKKKDAKGKLPNDPDYDPTTLFIPEAYLRQQTPAMNQFWKIKSQNFDKVLLFKLGKFYELFYDDAIIAHNILDLNWMGGAKKYHVGFPEKALDKYVPILVNNGYRVAVVEQTETPRQLEKRLKQAKEKNADKCVMRDLCNVYTKGTYFDVNDGSYEPKWILAFGCDFEFNVGIVFFDITTLKLHIGQFKDNQMFGKFRTLAMQLRPTEIIFNF